MGRMDDERDWPRLAAYIMGEGSTTERAGTLDWIESSSARTSAAAELRAIRKASIVPDRSCDVDRMAQRLMSRLRRETHMDREVLLAPAIERLVR